MMLKPGGAAGSVRPAEPTRRGVAPHFRVCELEFFWKSQEAGGTSDERLSKIRRVQQQRIDRRRKRQEGFDFPQHRYGGWSPALASAGSALGPGNQGSSAQ